jgi:hypothetical protein
MFIPGRALPNLKPTDVLKLEPKMRIELTTYALRVNSVHNKESLKLSSFNLWEK